ncbi:ImmA/IrrE family metallo-endopeptidase [Janthinobacterium sp. PC23-8]|uniref:ImmA/IrrE family metallo-endopeptidase n=1 Tax=Janthinobacterium sp. PC23-8 TaxID=2012679 RepID=UPI000B96F399|nr:ImmA/IrrE family metallo-endopeptidase [Janthinobacterium sp. PC23-8]OYO32202.1 hypothetical protein CD932_14500 [Janthinobacterium sp. PC23-8]
MVDIDSVLHFNFVPADDLRERADGYGAGTLFLDGAPFWFSNSPVFPQPVEWTWVDFLEHLAFTWPALMVEQTYPFEWLNKVTSHPGEMWDKAELRWSRQGDAIADVEEPILYAFHNRHNLSAGWKGIGMPGLYWLRVGKSVWLSPEGGAPIRADFNACMRSLEQIGNQLATSFSESNNQRVVAAVSDWNKRQEFILNSFFNFSTGLTDDELVVIEQGSVRAEFWGVSNLSGSSWEAVAANDNELLAAARMTKGILSSSATAELIKTIRQVPKINSPELDELGRRAVQYLRNSESFYAHEAGYRLAEWLRKEFALREFEAFDVESHLLNFGIPKVFAKFGSGHIEAMACYGQHGPCIIINDDRPYPDNNQRLRMTLAHELCHFLIDRHAALPVAEVLGGCVDLYVERRANAFAAELLLPRVSVAWARDQVGTNLVEIVGLLQSRFEVSKTVACAQIFNSPVFTHLSRNEQEYIQNRIYKLVSLKFVDEKIISGIV